MTDQISRLFEIGIGAIGLILAISLFVILNTQSSNLNNENTVNRLYASDNDYINYDSSIDGGEVIYSITNDTKSLIYILKNTTGAILLTITNCTDISTLSMIDITKTYNISYTIDDGNIKGITFTEM